MPFKKSSYEKGKPKKLMCILLCIKKVFEETSHCLGL